MRASKWIGLDPVPALPNGSSHKLNVPNCQLKGPVSFPAISDKAVHKLDSYSIANIKAWNLESFCGREKVGETAEALIQPFHSLTSFSATQEETRMNSLIIHLFFLTVISQI